MWSQLSNRLKKVYDAFADMLANEPHLSVVPLAGFVLGILIYFMLPTEPDTHIAGGIVTALLSLCLIIRCSRVKKILLLITPLFVALGFLLVTVRAQTATTRFLPHAVFNVVVEGKVVETRPRIDRVTVDLEPTAIYTRSQKGKKDMLSADEMPTKIRLTIYRDDLTVKKGDILKGTAFKLTRPPTAFTPYDLARAKLYWFEGIGAVGSGRSFYVVSKPQKTDETFSPMAIADAILETIREKIHVLFQQTFSAENAGIAEALVLGNTDFITLSARDLYRTLGLSHILAVSGFHIGLIAFLVYGIIRFVLTWLPFNLSPIRIKRIGVVGALLVAGGYTLLSGAHAPAVRSFIMVAFVLTAAFFDRRILSVRTVFCAGVFMLCLMPHLILSVSFQLSFAAVLCLTGIVNVFQQHFRFYFKTRMATWAGAFLAYILFNCLVTLATFPFVAYYFHQFQPYSVIGNVLFATLFATLIIPLLFVGVLLCATPLGTGLLLIVDFLLRIVYEAGMPIATAPYATVVVPYFHTYGLVLWGIGLMGLAIFRSKIRWLFIGMMALFIVSFWGIEKPVGIIGAGGNYIGVRTENGEIAVTESYYYPQWHSAFLLFDGESLQTFIPKRINRDDVEIQSVRIVQTPQFCTEDTVNIERRGMQHCPHLLSRGDLLDLHTVLIYQNESESVFYMPALREAKRVWGQPLPAVDVYKKKNKHIPPDES